VLNLNEKEIINLIEITLKDKLNKDSYFIRYTFYELRVKLNLSEVELYHFLRLIKIKLENLGYKVYFTGDKYIFNETNKQVEENELLIAIKEQEKNDKL
jgi:predicted RND superfamily exporter protein